MKQFFKICILISFLVGNTSAAELIRNDQSVALSEQPSEENLREIICTAYDYAYEYNGGYTLPAKFIACHRHIGEKATLLPQELQEALVEFTSWLTGELVKKRSSLEESERAPHPNSHQPVGPNGCCGDIDLALQLLRIINSKLGSTTDSSCQKSVLGILGDACAILGPGETISSGIKELLEDFNETWTILAVLTTPTIVINCDVSGVYTVLDTSFNETWTILATLTTPTIVINTDLSTVFSVLKVIEDLEELENHCPTELSEDNVLPDGYTITNPGYYTLCGSIGFDAPGTSSCVINIQVSNVTLDLNQNTIYQTDADAGLTGICIADSLTNIIIQNGYLSGFTSAGVSVGNGASEIVIKNITANNCSDAGILFNGTSGSPTRDVRVLHSQFSNNGNDGGQFLFTEKVKVNNSSFNDNTGVGALFSQSSSNEIVGSSFNQNGGAIATAGLEFNGTSSSVIRDCIFNANTSSSSSAAGFIVTGTGNLIDNCIADGNITSAVSNAIGFDLSGAAHILKNSSAAGNTALTGTGIGVRVNAAAYRCLVQNTTAFTNSTYGFLHNGGAGQNFLIGNISGGQGTDAFNFSGAGLGWLSITAGMQITTFNENQRVNNVSLT
jgi:hypothetical protein